jgi:membrane protease YdiL (CAAX protease family)
MYQGIGNLFQSEPTKPSGPDLREQLLELAVFLLLILPPLALSTLEIRHSSLPFPLAATATILDDLALVALILFFLWRNREPLARIGWTPQNLSGNVLLGLILFIPLFTGAGILEAGLSAAGLAATSTIPSFLQYQGIPGAALALLLVLVVAIAEETVFRGYLILRLQAVTSSPWAGVLLSSAIFSVGHGYEGPAGVITTGVIGAVYAVIYLSRRSLVPPVVLHFLQDFTTILLLPILGIR